MADALAALVKLASEIDEAAPSKVSAHAASNLAKQVLGFAESHVMVARLPSDGSDVIEAMVPFTSSLRYVGSAAGKPAWTIAPSAVVTVLQRAIPLLVRLGDYTRGEQLKIERAKETCRRAGVCLQGREWAPGRMMRGRYFIINIPNARLGSGPGFWPSANKYIDSKERFPLFWDMAMSLKYNAPRVCHFIGDSEIEE